ncbi:MAG TPA: hypothetical protein VK564_08345, partial [Thermodesulfobacteriota bacterium]|nr:hypothetical protein [Thermodesulfobacteriota bacterium]
MKILLLMMMASVIYWAFLKEDSVGAEEEGYSEDEKKFLHRLALEAIAHHLSGGPMPSREGETQKLSERRGAFVTLKTRGQLR